MISIYSVSDWVRWLGLDSADTSSVSDGDSDVSSFSPSGGPGVLDDVVFSNGLVNTVTDGEDTVVKGGSAGFGSDDTTGVLMEDRLVSFDGDRDWSVLEGSFEGIGGFWGDIVVGGNLDESLGFIVFACEDTGGGFVWVVGLGLEWIALSISEGKVHHTTVATMVQP